MVRASRDSPRAPLLWSLPLIFGGHRRWPPCGPWHPIPETFVHHCSILPFCRLVNSSASPLPPGRHRMARDDSHRIVSGPHSRFRGFPDSTHPSPPPLDETNVFWPVRDRIADQIRTKLNLSQEQLTLAQVLESATWKGGREIAKERRPQSGGPPIEIVSDGTVF